MKIKTVVIAGIVATVATGAFAAGENVPTSRAYVDSNVATKQAILSARSPNYAVTFPTTTGGAPGSRFINTIGGAFTDSTGVTETGFINTKLNEKQANINGTANTVVTYTGTSGGVSSKGVYNSGSAYSGQTSNLTEAQHVNAAVQNGFNARLTCANNDCTLYNVNTLSGTYVPQPANP